MIQATLGEILMDNYGLLKRKHSCRICSNKERISYMILKVIMAKLKTVLSLVLVQSLVNLFLFHAIMENGAIFYRFPITAFIQRGFKPADVPRRRLDELQLWNCFSYYPSVHSWDILEAQAGKYIGKDKKWHPGKYLFTVDFAHPEPNILDTDHSEIPHEHKCAHIIALDDGNYAAQPNNRCIWDIPSFTVKNNIPDWKVQTSEWNVENTSKWKTADTDDFFYEIEEKKHD